MLFTESDSLTYETKSEHIYEEFFKYKQLFGCSEYQSKFFDLLTKKLLAKWDVFKGITVNEFIGLKSKMHCILSVDVKEFNLAKGVKSQSNLMITITFCSTKK